MLSNQPHPQYFNHAHTSKNILTETNSNPAMRGLGPGENGGLADRKPSRLEQMRADYQKKLMKEKEEKMIHVYEDAQRKAMMKMTRNGSGNQQPTGGASSPNGGKSVREFFSERRRMEANGLPVPPIDNHYRQAKGYSSPGGWSSRTGSGNSLQQRSSAGRDRSKPLAPIRRPVDTQEVANNNNNVRSGIPQRQPAAAANRQGEENPFAARPRLVKHKPLPPTNGNHHVDDNSNGGLGQARPVPPSNLPKFSPQHRRPPHPPTQQQQNSNAAARARFGGPADKSPAAGGQEKLTEFQKWQLEQNKAREDRLRKLNTQKNGSPAQNGVWSPPGETPTQEEVQYEEEEEDGSDYNDEDDGDNESARKEDDGIKQKERELMERIAQQQRELERMQREREQEEEQERREMERMKKKEAMEKARMKKQEEEMRKEEERRMKEEEEEARMGRKREERDRKEYEKARKEEERRMKEGEKRRAQEEKQMLKRQEEEERRNKQQEKLSSRRDNYNNDNYRHFDEDSPLPSARRTATLPKSSREPKQSRSHESEYDGDERQLPTSGATMYEQAAMSSDAKAGVGKLASCKVCGRSFAVDRLKKHQDACKTANKPRKAYDSSKKRVEGTELAKYAGKAKRSEPPKKKSNWRAQHEQFIESLRYAKKVTQYEKEGGNLRDLPPPPAAQNPDFVPCPHCGRTFNETAAERHIPRCQSLKTRPPPMNTRRR